FFHIREGSTSFFPSKAPMTMFLFPTLNANNIFVLRFGSSIFSVITPEIIVLKILIMRGGAAVCLPEVCRGLPAACGSSAPV
ncbi:MAG: hypothetical protein K5767_01305, partial [Clostridia bacterium]|nr:hypothetical protein [Clostridia bacterium]